MAAFTVRGKNVEVTEALREYVEKRVGKVTKYFENVGDITVILSVVKESQVVEVTVPLPGGVILRGEEANASMYTSIDLVVEKLERQIRKHKTKLAKRMRGGSFKADMVEAVKEAQSAAVEAVAENEDYPLVKKKKFVVKPMDVQEAIMEMNMVNHDFFVFRDAATEEINVVYRRKDGKYGLIEPEA